MSDQSDSHEHDTPFDQDLANRLREASRLATLDQAGRELASFAPMVAEGAVAYLDALIKQGLAEPVALELVKSMQNYIYSEFIHASAPEDADDADAE